MPPEKTQTANQSQEQPPAGSGGTSGAGQAGGAAGSGGKPERPDWLPEEFFDAEKGPQYDKLTGELTGLRAFKAERDSELATVPDDLSGYEAALPDGFELPEGFEFKLADDDPVLEPARAFAKKHALSPAAFKELVGLAAHREIAQHKELAELASKQMEALGSKAAARVDAVQGWLKAKVGEDAAGQLNAMMFTAGQVQAFEKLIGATKSGVAGVTGAGREGVKSQPPMSQEEWDKLSPTDKIQRTRDLNAKKAA